eukprot:11773175-Heterocapsa_arctica.AAC.1
MQQHAGGARGSITTCQRALQLPSILVKLVEDPRPNYLFQPAVGEEGEDDPDEGQPEVEAQDEHA